MIYGLWHLDGGSIIGAWEAWDTEEEALALVRASLDAHGPDSVASWALWRDNAEGDADGELVNLAEGPDLVERARVMLTIAERSPRSKSPHSSCLEVRTRVTQ